jgi:hypothetical protein
MKEKTIERYIKIFKTIKPKRTTWELTRQLCSIFVIFIMVSVAFSGVVNKYFSEVGSPIPDQPNPYDWIIEDGDIVVRTDEDLILNGDLIVKPGGNLTLNNVKIQFNSSAGTNLKFEVESNITGNYSKMGELNIFNSNITVKDDDGNHFFDFIIRGNATIYNSEISYVGGSDPISGIQVYSDNVIISESEISNCKYAGIYVSADPIIFYNEIYDNKYGIYYKNSQVNITDIEGTNAHDKLGYSVSAVADLNNDSYDDIVIGVPYDDSNGPNTGAIYGFYCNDNIEIDDLELDDADLIIQGENPGDLFGSTINIAGDLNNDSINEIVIGAPGVNKTYIYFSSENGFSGILINDTSEDFQYSNLTGNITQMNIWNGYLRLNHTKHSWQNNNTNDFSSGRLSMSTIFTNDGHIKIFDDEYSPDASSIALWHLNDDNDFYIFDDSENNNNGSIFGCECTEDGFSGCALEFDGDDDFI